MNDSIQIKTIDTDIFSMDYFSFGQGEETLVILPGLSVQSVMDFADSIANAYHIFVNDFTVYVFDRRKDLKKNYSIYDMANDTVKALNFLKLENINLFGASQGGMIAMKIAIDHPDKVKKLVLGSTSAYVDKMLYPSVFNWIQLAKTGDREGLYLSFGEAVYPKEFFNKLKYILIESAKKITKEDMDRFAILAKSINDFDIRDDINKISCPVFVIGSNDDQVLGVESSIQISNLLKDNKSNKLYIYNGFGHAAYDLAPDYKDRIFNFLKSNQ